MVKINKILNKIYFKKPFEKVFSKTIFFSFFILIATIILYVISPVFRNQVHNIGKPQIEKIEYLRITGIDDGDTIVLENGETVRYLGIDTPETHHPTIGKECGGQEASEYNKKLVEGKKVRLIKDVSDKDQYGRILRYVFTEDGQFVNYLLVRNGFAQTLPIPPDTLFDKTFENALKEAKNESLGIWKDCFNQKGVNNNGESAKPN